MCSLRSVVLGRIVDMGRILGTSGLWPLACRAAVRPGAPAAFLVSGERARCERSGGSRWRWAYNPVHQQLLTANTPAAPPPANSPAGVCSFVGV